MALTKPTSRTIVPADSTYDEVAALANEVNAVATQMPGVGAPTPIVIDANGMVTPTTSRLVSVNAFGGAATDFLDFIALSAVPDGVEVVIELASTLQTITVRHLMDTTGLSGAGQIYLRDGDSPGDGLVLDDLFKSVVLRCAGTQFVEIDRRGFPVSGSTIGARDQDFGGHAILGAKFGYRHQTGTAYTLRRSIDRGLIVRFRDACLVTLPSPNDQSNPDTGEWWQPGDVVPWHAGAADLIGQLWNGNPPTSAANHDRALGQYATGSWMVHQDPATGLLYWTLEGNTKAAPSPGPGPGPGPGLISRTYAYAKAAADTTLPDDTAWHGAGSLTHAYGASEKWLYLAHFGLQGAGSSTSNPAVARFVKNTGSDVEIGHAGRGRYPQDVERIGMLWGQTYGGTPGSATYRVDAQNAQVGFATTVGAPLIFGIRLEAGEDYAQVLGPVTTTTPSDTVWTDVCTLTLPGTQPADDYGILAQMEATAGGNYEYRCRLLIDGVAEQPVTCMRDVPAVGSYFAASPVTFATIAAHTIKLQIQLPAAGVGSVSASNATVGIVRKALFQKFQSDKSAAASSYTSNAYAAKLSDSWALQTSYFSLVLASAQGYVPGSAAPTACWIRHRRNGALLTPSAALATRDEAGAWSNNSFCSAAVVTPATTTDAFDLGVASADGASAVQAEGAGMLALALGPTP